MAWGAALSGQRPGPLWFVVVMEWITRAQGEVAQRLAAAVNNDVDPVLSRVVFAGV